MPYYPPAQPPAWLSRIIIRQLVQEDLPALEWGGEFAHFRRLYADIYQSACKGNAVMWIAELNRSAPEIDARLIGQLFVQLSSERRELADGIRRAYIYGFRIQRPYRGFGLGTRMMQIAERDVTQRGFQFITLNVNRENISARRLYERLGYRIVAAEPGKWSYLDENGHRQEVHEPAWRMEKRLLAIR